MKIYFLCEGKMPLGRAHAGKYLVLLNSTLKAGHADRLKAFEAFVRVKGQQQLVFDGKANTLACARRAYFSIAAIGAEDAVPENDVTTVVGICLAALQSMMTMMLLRCRKEPVPHRHRHHGQVGMVKLAIPHTEGS